jgi:hypothetical protein
VPAQPADGVGSTACGRRFNHKPIAIPTLAFGDQDAAGFCAELKWRWERREQLQKAPETEQVSTHVKDTAKA